MTAVRLLVDNDVVVKLAQLDCYSDTLRAIGCPATEVGSLGFMLRYMGKASAESRLRLAKDPAAADRLALILPKIVEIEPTQDQKQLAAKILKQALLADLDLDPGEVGLMAVGVDLPGADLATGDKKALLSMPAVAKLEQRLLQLRERLICFEQLMGRLCHMFGIKRVRKAVTTFPTADTTLSKAYDRYSTVDDGVFVQLMDHVGRKHLEHEAPGWLKAI